MWYSWCAHTHTFRTNDHGPNYEASLLINYLWKIAWVDYVATVAILIFVGKEALESISEIREAKSSLSEK